MNTTIAGVILTKNEEICVAKALASLQWCNEIIVLDSGSTDHTEKISRAFTNRFYQHIQKPPFLITEQRNWALSNCDITSEWVLFLDADEEVSSDLQARIITQISSSAPFNAYELAPRYWFFGKWLKRTQGFPIWHPRLLKRREVHLEGGVWECFTSSAVTGRIEIPYEHYAFCKGLDDWLERHQRYAKWDANKIIEKGKMTPSKPNTKEYIRNLSYTLWALRPPSRFLHKYLFNLGFLEGWRSLVFSLLMFFYELLVVIYVIQSKRLSKGLTL